MIDKKTSLLAVTALVDELPFDRINLLIEQEIGLVDQANERIRSDGGITMIKPPSTELPAPSIGQIGQLRLIRPIAPELPRHIADG